MASIIDYEQDEEKPFGVGTFRLDDGSEYYLDDPGRAQDFLSQFKGELDSILSEPTLSTQDRYDNATNRLALGPNAPQIDPRPRFTRPDPMRGAVAGPGGGEDEPLMSVDPSSAPSSVPNESRAPEKDDDLVSRAPLTEEQLREQEEARRVSARLSAIPTHRRVAGVDPEKMQRDGKPVDKQFVRQGGLPDEVYQNQKADRQAQFDSGNALIEGIYNEKAAAQQAETERLRSEALALKQKNDAEQLTIQRKQVKYQEDRTFLEREVEAYYDKSKPSPDGGLRARRGPVGNLASAIAQFMGAYAAIISGSPNFANQILNRKIDLAVDAEIEEFKRGKMKRDGQLARMAERGMSVEQMKAALKLQQERYISKEAELRASIEGTRESKAAYQSLMLGREERSLELEQQFQREALGKTSISGDIVQPRSGGLVPLTTKEKADEAAAMNKLVDELEGGENVRKERWRHEDRTERRTEREQDRADKRDEARAKVSDDQAKAESAWDVIEAYGDAAGIKKDPKTGERVADQGLFSRDTLIAPGQRESVNDLTGQGKPIEAARQAAIEGLGRLQSGGVIGPDEAKNFSRMLGDPSATRAQIATNLNALRRLIQKRRSANNQQKPTGAPSSWGREDEE